MKKLLSIIMALCLTLSVVLSAVSCGDSTDGKQEGAETSKAYLNGVLLSDYSIVYSEEGDYAYRAAEYIKDEIEARAGVTLSVRKASEDSGEGRAILVGETARELSAKLCAECDGVEFAISSDGEDIALEAEAFVIAAAAYYFIDTYIPSGIDFESVVPSEDRVLEPIKKSAKNFILMIGDGMGELQTQMFDYLEDTSEISDGESAFYGYMLPYHGYSVTNSLSGTTDSAAAATAMATGYKTYNRYLGLDGDKTERKNLTELSLELGKSVGILTTDTLTGATPSGFTVHVEDRGSSNEIRAQQNKLITDRGVIIDGNYSQYTPNIMKTIEKKVTDTLGKLSEDSDGFFMMYEEAHIDKKCSAGNIDDAFLSLIRFNQVIGRVMEFAFYNPDTVVIITADHETGDLTVNEEGKLVLNTDEHTSKNVPIFAYGMGADAFGATMENTEIPKIIAGLWGVEDFAK